MLLGVGRGSAGRIHEAAQTRIATMQVIQPSRPGPSSELVVAVLIRIIAIHVKIRLLLLLLALLLAALDVLDHVPGLLEERVLVAIGVLHAHLDSGLAMDVLIRGLDVASVGNDGAQGVSVLELKRPPRETAAVGG